MPNKPNGFSVESGGAPPGQFLWQGQMIIDVEIPAQLGTPEAMLQQMALGSFTVSMPMAQYVRGVTVKAKEGAIHGART